MDIVFEWAVKVERKQRFVKICNEFCAVMFFCRKYLRVMCMLRYH